LRKEAVFKDKPQKSVGAEESRAILNIGSRKKKKANAPRQGKERSWEALRELEYSSENQNWRANIGNIETCGLLLSGRECLKIDQKVLLSKMRSMDAYELGDVGGVGLNR